MLESTKIEENLGSGMLYVEPPRLTALVGPGVPATAGPRMPAPNLCSRADGLKPGVLALDIDARGYCIVILWRGWPIEGAKVPQHGSDDYYRNHDGKHHDDAQRVRVVESRVVHTSPLRWATPLGRGLTTDRTLQRMRGLGRRMRRRIPPDSLVPRRAR